MKRQQRILTGTALGLLMASTPLVALPLKNDPAVDASSLLILAQAEGDGSAENGQPAAEQTAPEPQPAPEPAAAPAAAPEPAVEQAPQPTPVQAQQEPEAAEPPAEMELPRKKRKQSQEQAEPAEQSAPAEAAPAQQEAPAAEPEQPRKKPKPSEEQAEPAPAEQPAPTEAAPAEKSPEAKPAEPEQKPAEKKPAKEEPAAKPAEEPTQAKPTEKPAEPEAKPAERPAAKPAEQPAQSGEKPASEQPKPAEPAQGGEKPATGEQKPAGQVETTTKPADQPQTGEQPKAGEPTQPAQGAQQPAPAQSGQQPASGEQKPAGQQTEAPPANPNAAPIFDSQKERPAEGQQGGTAAQPVQPVQPVQPQPGQPTPAGQPTTQQPVQPVQPAEKAPPPVDDKAAQVTIQPEKIVPVTEEKGTRLERAPDFDVRRRPRPEGADIIKNFGDRTIIQFNNQIIVESNDRPRITRDAQEVYYEDLPRGRTRETIVRDNGNQIITIRNRNGDIIRRSRITPDGHEYVLSYVDERYYEEIDEWRDPGDELPPIYIDIPRQEYILESEYVRSPDDYYVFLERPPVEKVKRLYSIDEVKRSARVRDIARRIDLDTLNFEFGSAAIPESEVEKLQGVADAMQKLLAKNPAETFLIEGHTDAVGSDVANLALSDRRAEAVANALSSVFDVPPENLSTQGYGERYLKVKTQKPERENRRVAIRRITPLVAPVASAK